MKRTVTYVYVCTCMIVCMYVTIGDGDEWYVTNGTLSVGCLRLSSQLVSYTLLMEGLMVVSM